MNYNADQLLGLTLFATTNIKLYRIAGQSNTHFQTVYNGQAIGVIYSWVNVGSTLYWMFESAGGDFYYVRHGQDRFRFDEVEASGIPTIEEQIAENQAANETILDRGEKLIKYGIGALVIGGIIKYAISKSL